MDVPYHTDASLNAVFLLQKQAVQFQANSLSNLIGSLGQSTDKIVLDSKIPLLLNVRSLPDEYSSNGRMLDNEEITILGFLDSSGKISVSSRLNEFMLLMTRVTKVRTIFILNLF